MGWPSRIRRQLRMIGMGSTPVSAILPAKTEMIEGTSGLRTAATPRTCSSVKSAVMFSLTPCFARSPIRGRDDSPREFVMGIFV